MGILCAHTGAIVCMGLSSVAYTVCVCAVTPQQVSWVFNTLSL